MQINLRGCNNQLLGCNKIYYAEVLNMIHRATTKYMESKWLYTSQARSIYIIYLFASQIILTLAFPFVPKIE